MKYKRHNLSNTPTYRSWRGMLDRCLNPKPKDYKNYAGRGITVCERWRFFSNFLSDMGVRPKGTSLDRINNDGGYEPSNCRWATLAEQHRNTRRTKLDAIKVSDIKRRLKSGVSQAKIAAEYSVTPSLISHINKGDCWGDVA